MVAKIQFHKFSQLTDSIRKISAYAESGKGYQSYTAVVMELHSWLRTPQIYILIEIPVGSYIPLITPVIPVLAIQSLPNDFQCIIILNVLIRLP